MAEGQVMATNAEILEYLELPDTIVTALGSKEVSVYQPARNQFLNAIVNKILYQYVDSPNVNNPFEKYDGAPINYGDTIENVYTRLPKGYKFDPNATDPFTKKKPEVITLYGTINYEMQYEVTIEDALLRRAVLSEYGFMNLINKILGNMPKRMRLDHYFATLRMLNNQDLYADGFEKVTRGATDEETAKVVTRKIVDTVTSFALPSTANNALGEYQITDKSKVLLIIKQELLNSINLDYLAGVYNLSKVDLINNIIPVQSFQVQQEDEDGKTTTIGEDLDFIILDTDGFDMHKALEDGGEIYNPKGKYTNHFLNSWKVFAFKYYFNARAFKLSAASSAASNAE